MKFETASSENAKILIVDDTPANIDVLRQILEPEGYHLCIATNGEKALKIAGIASPDLILLDVMMPGIDGFETCERLKSDNQTKQIPVIFVTGKDDVRDFVRGFSVGAVDYIHKPINREEVVARVRAHVTLRSLMKAVKQAKDEAETTLNAIRDVIITVKNQSAIRYLNPAALKMLALTGDTFLETFIDEHLTIHHNHIDFRLGPLITESLDKNEIVSIKKGTVLKNHSDETFTVEGSISPIMDADSKPIGAVISLHDITDSIQLERALAQADKMKSLGVLSAGVAHEIRNPLGSMIQSGQNISRRIDSKLPANVKIADELGITIETIHEYCEKRRILDFIDGIRVSGARAASIVTSLLQLTHEANEGKFECKISDLIAEGVEKTKKEQGTLFKIDFDQIKINTNINNEPANFKCVKSEMEQVFSNLFTNSAFAFSGIDRNPEINITINSTDDKMTIIVSDNGSGIKPEDLKQVFEPFFTTKDIGEGVGLGLTVVYSIIVYNHDGEIEITSTPGKETTVKMTLPLGDSSEK